MKQEEEIVVVVLYRSGRLKGSVIDAPPPSVAVFFDNISTLLGFPKVRSSSVFFNICEEDAMHWCSQRIYEGVDANIYSVQVPSEELYAYNVRSYNRFNKLHEQYSKATCVKEASNIFKNLLTAVEDYHLSKVSVSEWTDSSERYEVLVPGVTAKKISEWKTVYEPNLL